MNAIASMSRAAYEKQPGVNWSTLKLMKRSPAHYRHRLTALGAGKDTDAMQRGRITHLAVFEPERFSQDVVVWDGGSRRGKDWEAFKRQNQGRECVTTDMLEQAQVIGAAARANAIAMELIAKGQSEQTLLWTHPNGLAAKGRVDFIAGRGIVDLKTCRDASPRYFGVQSAQLNYCEQAAYYVDGYEAITGKRVPYLIVSVEVDEPYVVQVYEVTAELLELGRENYKPLLEKVLVCQSSNHWPGYSEGIEQLQLPRWATPKEEGVEGMGLTGEGLTGGNNEF